jgi:hypothetical protein
MRLTTIRSLQHTLKGTAMRSFIVMAMFVASLASATWKEHTEARHLQLPAEGITVFELDTGAGSLTIKGMPDARNIRVKAIIRVPKETEERAQKVIASDLKLTLDKSRDHAKLKAKFDSKFWGSDSGGSILKSRCRPGWHWTLTTEQDRST